MSRALEAHHLSSETPTIEVDGIPAPQSFGEDLQEGCRVLREGAALVDLNWRRHLVLTGRHRARFLHNMSTCQVKELTPGQGRYGMTVGSDGKLVGDFFLAVDEEALALESTHSNVERIRAHLKSHIIADDVQLTPSDERSVLALVGPRAGTVLQAMGGDPDALPEDLSTAAVTIQGVPMELRRNDQRLLLPGWDLTCPSEAALDVWTSAISAGASPVGVQAWEAVRVAQGIPNVPQDMGLENIPLESAVLGTSLDWEKGCYIGQEVIAMMHYRGRPNRHLVGLRLDPTADLPPAGTALISESGKTIGNTGTAVTSPELGGPFALAVIRRKHAISEKVVKLATGSTGEVVLHPFLT